MTGCATTDNTRGTARSAFSLIEVLVSLLLISGLFVAAVNTVGAAKMSQFKLHNATVGNLLAQGLMTEILGQSYEDPNDPPVFSLESTEFSSVGRSLFDDVDDYRFWGPIYPERSDGTPIPGFTGWTRGVVVDWVTPSNLANTSLTPTGVKRVTVSAFHNGDFVAKSVAIRTNGPPPPQAFGVLLIVTDVANPTLQEAARITLLESWRHVVTLIAASDSAANFTAASANADIVYWTRDVGVVQFSAELRSTMIGVILEDPSLTADLGFSSGSQVVSGTDIRIDNSTHQITSGFAVGPLTIVNTTQPLWVLDGARSVSLVTLASIRTAGTTYLPSLSVSKTNGTLYGGGVAAGRRVALPWGGSGFDINALNANGRKIMEKAVEWAGNGPVNGTGPTPMQ